MRIPNTYLRGERPSWRTLLGVVNRFAECVLGVGLIHTVEIVGNDVWHPWWCGTHRPGSWFVEWYR